MYYLYQCYIRALDEKGKSWNNDPKFQKFIDYSVQVEENLL